MRQFLIGGVFAVAMVSGFSIPAQAATVDSVVGTCSTTTAGETNKSVGCVVATQSYLSQIKNLPADKLDSDVSDLVFKLGQLAELEKLCVPDSELAQAIALASSYIVDTAQKAQIEQISVTIAQCSFNKTASIGQAPAIVTATPPLVTTSNGGGPPASCGAASCS